MKNCFYSLLVSSLFLIGINTESKAQTKELAKPEQKTEAKKSKANTNLNGDLNTDGTNTSSKTKIEEFGTPNNSTPVVNENPYNATKDQSDYQAQKIQWIKEHPKAYKKYSGNPNLVILTETELNALSADEKSRILADEANYLIIRQ